MPSRRPKSLSGLLTLSFVVLAFPLLIAVAYGAAQLRDLSKDSDRLLRQSVETTRLTQGLFREITALERAANLYVVLGDARLAEAFDTALSSVNATLSALADLAGDPALSQLTRRVHEAAGSIQVRLSAPEAAPAERAATLQDDFSMLWALAGEVTTTTEGLIETRLDDLEGRTARSQKWLFWSLAALAPAALLLAFVFAWFVLRPLRQIDAAIAGLGRGGLVGPIAIEGPSDLEALGRQLEWLRGRLQEVAEEKNRFLRHMSHELKTPLANIREGTDLLAEGAVGPLDAAQREVAGILQENALKLQRLIENLLSYSAWQSQATRLEITDFRLPSLVGTVVDAQRLALAARNIELDIDVEEIQLRADRSKLKLVLDNLLSNALKFTPQDGTIHILGRVEGETAVIDFADTGPGIPEVDQQRVFDAFYSGTVPQTGPLKGTGIGLSVVREFVQAHGGSVELARGSFPGAHFRIRLPISSLGADPSIRRSHAA